jgi:hypothetical protein
MRSLLLLSLVLALPAVAQPAAPCTTEAAAGLDFWVGTWELAWDTAAGPNTGSGTNAITRDLGGCVVHERFADHTPGSGFAGESVSMHTPQGWRQTWVDNAGAYLLFSGATDADGRVTEMRSAPFANPQGQTQVNRMVWEDVTEAALTWRWQSSTDDGATWADAWVIRYTRAETP